MVRNIGDNIIRHYNPDNILALMKKLGLIILIWLAWFAFSKAAAPKLFFSDLTDGPISGWEQSAQKGAAVSVWGLNFDTTRGAGYITCGGVNLTGDTSYAEWGVINACTDCDSADEYTSARNLERITFWLNSSMATGATHIKVTTSEGSDSVPFYCRELGSNHIYFMARDGNDSDSGFYADTAGHGSEGPWKLATKVRTIKAGDIAYFRGGIWNEEDATDAVIEFHGNHNSGEENKSITMTSYPGEIAQLGDSSIANVIERWGVGIPDTFDYWTISKFMMRAGTEVYRGGEGSVMSGHSEYVRFVGNDVSVYENGHHGWGFCGGQGMNYLSIYGNHIHDIGVSNRGDTITLNPDWRNYPIYVLGYGTLNHIDMGWNEFSYNEKGRLQFYGHLTGDWVDSLYLHDNYVHHHGYEGITCGGGDASPPYEFIKHAWIYNNIIASNGTRGSSAGWGLLMGGESNGGHKGSWYVYNNTFYGNNEEPIRITAGIGDPPDTMVIKNNVIYANSGKAYYDPNGYTSGSFFYGSDNCYYNGTSGVPAWDSIGSFETDPIMSNPADGDFHLQSNSPCVDSGVTIAMTSPDYEGNERPYSSAYDIGAYEYYGGDATPPDMPDFFSAESVSSSPDSTQFWWYGIDSTDLDTIVMRADTSGYPSRTGGMAVLDTGGAGIDSVKITLPFNVNEPEMWYFSLFAGDTIPNWTGGNYDSVIYGRELIQFVTKLDTAVSFFVLWDSVYTTYSISPDSAVLWVNTANNLGGATRKDAFQNDNADSLQAIGLSENTEYYFWCLAWDVGVADTTAVDSITTETSPPGPQKYLMMRK